MSESESAYSTFAGKFTISFFRFGPSIKNGMAAAVPINKTSITVANTREPHFDPAWDLNGRTDTKSRSKKTIGAAITLINNNSLISAATPPIPPIAELPGLIASRVANWAFQNNPAGKKLRMPPRMKNQIGGDAVLV